MTPQFREAQGFAAPVIPCVVQMNCLGDVVEIVRDYSPRMYLVRFTGKTTEGKFNGKRNLRMTVLKSNCTPLGRGQL